MEISVGLEFILKVIFGCTKSYRFMILVVLVCLLHIGILMLSKNPFFYILILHWRRNSLYRHFLEVDGRLFLKDLCVTFKIMQEWICESSFLLYYYELNCKPKKDQEFISKFWDFCHAYPGPCPSFLNTLSLVPRALTSLCLLKESCIILYIILYYANSLHIFITLPFSWMNLCMAKGF